MPSPRDLKAHAVEFLDRCKEKNLSKGATYLHKSMTAYHDDNPPVKGAGQFIAGWTKAIQFIPNFKIEVKDAVKDGNKVWLFSKITGLPGGVFKDSVDRSVWGEEGKFVETKDVQRVLEQGQ